MKRLYSDLHLFIAEKGNRIYFEPKNPIVSQKVCLRQVCLRSDDAKLIDNFVFHIKKVNFMLYLDEERVLQRRNPSATWLGLY